MAKFGHKPVAGSPTADVDQKLADQVGVSLYYLQKNIYGILPLSEEEAADIDDTSFFAENADAGAVVEPAQADEPVSTPKATGKRPRPTDDEAQRTPRASKPPGEANGDDGSPEFQKRPPPSPVFHRGIRPHDRQMSAAIHKNNSKLFEYYEDREVERHRQLQKMSATAIKGLMDMIEARFMAMLAKQDQTIRILQDCYAAEIQTLNGKIQTLTDELSEVKIMQTRMAASVAHQQQQPQHRQQPHQQQQPQQRQQQRPRNPNPDPPPQPRRSAPELNEEEFPRLPTSEWKVREGRYTQKTRKRQEREEDYANLLRPPIVQGLCSPSRHRQRRLRPPVYGSPSTKKQ
jgi:hypothetical protein